MVCSVAGCIQQVGHAIVAAHNEHVAPKRGDQIGRVAFEGRQCIEERVVRSPTHDPAGQQSLEGCIVPVW